MILIKNVSKLFFCFVFLTANAQSPQKMSCQAVIRNASNNLVTNNTVAMKISILQGSTSGTVVYVETQTPTTNINGLATFEIGTGSIISGTFATINWANGPYFIKTETDPTGGTSYSIVGTSEFLSVPYALYSLNGTPGPQGIPGVAGLLPNGNAPGNTPFWDGTSWIINNSNIFNNGGNIGVGTTTPLSNFHINGNANGGISSLISNTSNANNAYSISSLTNDTSTGMHLFLNSSSRNSDGGINGATIRNDAGNLHLQAKGGGGITLKENTGNVGIGTTTPSVTLDVAGTIRTEILNIPSFAGIGKVLTSDASGYGTWQNNTLPTSTVAGQVLTANATGTPSWQNNTLPTSITAGQVLTANNSGIPSWQNISTNATYSHTSVGTIAANSTFWNFVGSTQVVTIKAGQMIEVTATLVLGSAAVGGATMDNISIGKRLIGSGISDNGLDNVVGLKAGQNMKLPLTLSTIFTGLAAGTYEIGMVYITSTSNWNNNGRSRLTVKVLN